MRRAVLKLFGFATLVACGESFSSGQVTTASSSSESSAGGSGGVATSSSGGSGGIVTSSSGSAGGVSSSSIGGNTGSSGTGGTTGSAGHGGAGGSGGIGGMTTSNGGGGHGAGGVGGMTTSVGGGNVGGIDGGVDAGTDGGADSGACICTLDHAKSFCVNGDCSIAKCDQGYADCDGDPMTGCEVSIKIDANNCGACNKVCGAWPNSSPMCANGVCGPLCSSDFANCNNAIGDGCEVNLKTDPAHCGTCQTVCSVANGVAGCTSGSCTVATCDPNRGDCNGLVADGCEVSLKTDPAHCGTCQNICSIANGTPGCTNGSCSVAACNAAYADCNGLVADGCEVSLKTDPAHCGTCQTACSVPNGTPGCINAACTVTTCDPNRGDCNGLVADGCEALTQTDMNNCGKCGTVCGANTVCLNGFCNPIGLCGPIPQVGMWMCYKIPSHESIVANSHVGFAGGLNAGFGDPFSGPLGNCISSSALDDSYICNVGALTQGTIVRLMAGLHANVVSGTSAGGWACDGATCVGGAELYFAGKVVGTMSNSMASGALSLVPMPERSNRLGLSFIVP